MGDKGASSAFHIPWKDIDRLALVLLWRPACALTRHKDERWQETENFIKLLEDPEAPQLLQYEQ